MTLLDRVVNERCSEKGLKVPFFYSNYKYLILGQINIFMWAEVQMYMHTYTFLYEFVYLYRETEKIIIFFLDILYIWRELTVMHLIIEVRKVYLADQKMRATSSYWQPRITKGGFSLSGRQPCTQSHQSNTGWIAICQKLFCFNLSFGVTAHDKWQFLFSFTFNSTSSTKHTLRWE